MKNVFILMGNFGVGKSSITNFYEHTDVEGDPLVTEVHNLISPGGRRGADVLNSKGWDKQRFYEELIPKYADRDILLHSVFYQNIQDINRLLKTHKVTVFLLRTPYETNAKRIAERSEGKKTIDDKSFVAFIKMAEKVRQFCVYSKAKFYRIDNDRPLEEVASEIWDMIDRECGRFEVIGDSFSPSKPDGILADL